MIPIIAVPFNSDLKMGLFIRQPLSPAHFSQAETWLLSRKTALRTLDALTRGIPGKTVISPTPPT